MRTIRGTPVWVWLLLVAAVFGVSSAGALFQQVDEATTFTTCLLAFATYFANTCPYGGGAVDSASR